MPYLTVRETVRFAAGLRLPSWMSGHEKSRRAGEVILQMGPKDCAHSLIGNEFKKGTSGGEKRRVSIAIQILTDPRILLLDEPTSGLDAFTASSVLDILQRLGDEGRTIVMTIHQARSDAFRRFDNVLLLIRGGIVAYGGPGHAMIPHFRDRLGFSCPPTTNPADFLLDLITVDLRHEAKEVSSRVKVAKIVGEWVACEKPLRQTSSHVATPAELSSLKREMNPFHITLPIVMCRSVISIRRSPNIITARTMQVLGITIILTVFLAPLKSNYESIQSRMGFIMEVAALYYVSLMSIHQFYRFKVLQSFFFRLYRSVRCLERLSQGDAFVVRLDWFKRDTLYGECTNVAQVGMLQNPAFYPLKRDTFYREHTDGCYTAFTFLLSYTLLELPFTVISSLVFGMLTAFAIRLKSTAVFGFIAAFESYIITCGESIGIIFCSIFSSHDGFTINVTSTLLIIAMTMACIIRLNIPKFVDALNYLSPLRYQVASSEVYSLRGQQFDCTPAQTINGQCPLSTGEQVLNLYSLDVDPRLHLMGLGIVAIVYHIIAYFVLSVRKR